MKLQGKKTGTVANFIGYIDDASPTTIDTLTGYTLLTVRYKDSGVNCYKDYRTIAEFNEDWEDYKPAEPLIKDEKIRKAVRAWAKANGAWLLVVVSSYRIEISQVDAEILFNDPVFKDLPKNRKLTIEELCGEEEE